MVGGSQTANISWRGALALISTICFAKATRIAETNSKTEYDVESEVSEIIDKTTQLVVCTYPPRDLDRLLSFYKAATESGRDLVIDLKQAYLLKPLPVLREMQEHAFRDRVIRESRFTFPRNRGGS